MNPSPDAGLPAQTLKDVVALQNRLKTIFGPDPERINERLHAYCALVDNFEKIYGPQDRMTLVRAPARINLKGVHIDHRGGHVNYVTIDREIVMAVSRRDDDVVVVHDQEEGRFAPGRFSIGEDLPPKVRGNWLAYIEQTHPTQGDWSNYIRAAVLRLQDHFRDTSLRGMNLLVSGNIPIAAGLSSSSALVVAASEAFLWANGLSLPDDLKTTLYGEGEWYVGTRGGAGDHAAMIFGKKDHLIRLRFFPLTVEALPFPPDYRVVVCNSLRQAHKADGAKSTFNERVANYEIALLLLRHRFPLLAERLRHLPDLNPRDAGIGVGELYALVADLPERITRDALLRTLPTHADRLEHLFRTHTEPPQGYRVRAVCLFGIAECERSRVYADYLSSGNMETVGRLMYLSHDGDRVVSFDGDGVCRPWDNRTSDAYLQRLVADAESSDPIRRSGAELWRQPGGYRCSCEELDHLVDIARTVSGVVGANLTGAGLGGCVLVLVREDAVQTLVEAVETRYYVPRDLPPSVMVCASVQGAGRIL
ncbi:MAG: hypothetical protein FJY97_11065 [candidate division Zixibacteria bacterium]|nr:hypothetical protein [candidate division Zixibacteria bacterium]